MLIVDSTPLKISKLALTEKGCRAVSKYTQYWNPMDVNACIRIFGIDYAAYRVLRSIQDGFDTFKPLRKERGLTSIRLQEILEHLTTNNLVEQSI